VLTGFLHVDSDAGSTTGVKRADYGRLRLLELPRDTTVPGPGQADNLMRSDAAVTQQLTFFGANGQTKVTRGNLLTVPLAGGLLYVQPVYVQSTGSLSFPLLRKVLVGFGDKVGMGSTLPEALSQVFAKNSGGTPSPGTGGSGTPTTPTPSPSPSASPGATPTATPGTGGQGANPGLSQARADAERALQDSQAAMRTGNWTAYGDAQRRLEAAITAALAAQGTPLPGGASSPSPSPSPSPSSTGGN